MDQRRLKHDDYTVAWICPLPVEQFAALAMLDERHQRLPQPEHDHNTYNLGSIYGHNVVIARLPMAGNCFAATVVAQLRNTFPRLRFGLLVGIGGGVPTITDEGPVRLGHVVVSQPVGQHSGAVQYDHGKAEANKFVQTGYLAPPPHVLLNAALEAQVHRLDMSTDPLTAHLNRIDTTKPRLRHYRRPQADQDVLYEPSYIHLDKEQSCKRCGCDASKRVNRNVEDSDDDSVCENDDDWVVIHRGTIASGEAVMRNGFQRDALAVEHKILCFEMEAAGALNDFPCLVVRGISDYSDSHKNDKWHGYAAAVATAYARELFNHMPVDDVKQCKIAEKVIEELVQNTRQFADNSEDSQVKAWLKPTDASINYVNASKLRHPNTGRWFLGSDQYLWFKSTSNARLWLRGIPGSGKTVLASTVIGDLKLDDGPDITVIYFFFSFNDQSTQKLEDMLRSLVFQLAASHKSAKVHLMKLYKSCAIGHQQPQMNELVDLFEQMSAELRGVTVVLDALDESKERRDLLRWITSSANQHCKFVLFSRSELDIEDALVSWLPPDRVVTLEDEPTGEDLKAYIHHRLHVEINLGRMRSIHDEISDVLVAKAGGMFWWVYCQLEELSTCMDNYAVRQVLQKLPKDLTETYDRIMQNIPQTRAHNAIKLLQLLIFSRRPLSLEEIVDAIATEPEDEIPFASENRVNPAKAIIGYCPSLVRLTTSYEPRYNDNLEDDNRLAHEHEHEGRMVIQLAHFSVQEYLLLDRKENPYHAFFVKQAANARITRIFLAYLWTVAQASKAQQDVSEFPLIYCVTWEWLEHAKQAGDSDESTLALITKFFTDDDSMRYWWKLHDSIGPEPYSPTLPLYYASLGGLYRSVKYLLGSGADANNASQTYGNALRAACQSGSIETVQLLLDYGADLNPEGVDETALQAAASAGYAHIVCALLDNGASVNTRDPEYKTALYRAIERGHVKVVQVLLENGANVDSHGLLMTPLQAACRLRSEDPSSEPLGLGSLRIIRMLLDYGADVNAQNGHWGSALTLACESGYVRIVQMLLDAGADINSTDGRYTAIGAAAHWGHQDVVQMLLNQGADINARDRHCGSALTSACQPRSGHMSREVVQYLLDNGADVDVEEGEYGSVLCSASRLGDVEVVEMLLRAGANANAVGGRYGNALCAAAYHGHNEVLRVLLDGGADPNAFEGEYGYSLCAASRFNNLGMVNMLLREGANVNAIGGKYGCALRAAAWHGHIEVLRVLLDNGAISDTRGPPYRSALQDAISQGETDTARILFEEGAKRQLAITKVGRDARLAVTISAKSTQRDSGDEQPRRHSFHL